jgi:hypothetical protein
MLQFFNKNFNIWANKMAKPDRRGNQSCEKIRMGKIRMFHKSLESEIKLKLYFESK